MPRNSDTTDNKKNDKPLFPLFYQSVIALTSKNHGELKINTSDNVDFAKEANSILITAAEFPEAALHYPIVFGLSNLESIPFVVTGHTAGDNLFIGDNGKWRANCYIPAYVRRYPFILVENNQKDSLTLACDRTSTLFSTEEGAALFEDDQPSEAANRIMQLCLSYHQQFNETKKLCAKIEAMGLLVDRQADVTLPNGKKTKISSFRVINEEKFNALDDQAFLDLRRTGALAMIYCHFLSMRNWQKLRKDASSQH